MHSYTSGKPIRFYLAIAAFLGATAVVAGAFGAHALKAGFSGDQLQIWKTASQYQLLHAGVLLAISLSSIHKMKMIRIASGLMAAGVVLFSGSLYLLLLTELSIFGLATPIGGLMLISAWLLLFYSAFKAD